MFKLEDIEERLETTIVLSTFRGHETTRHNYGNRLTKTIHYTFGRYRLMIRTWHSEEIDRTMLCEFKDITYMPMCGDAFTEDEFLKMVDLLENLL